MCSWLVGVVLCLLLSVPAHASRSVAVVPLKKATADEAYDGLGTALAGMIITDLSQVPDLLLVERERLGDILKEIELAETGFLDRKTAQRLGRGVGAELLVTGSFSVIKEKLFMDTRMVLVESGKVVKAADANGPLEDFVSVEKQVVETLLDGLKVKLSMATRRKLLIETPTENLDALAQYGRGVEATDQGDLDAAKAAFEQAIQQDPTFALAARALADLKAKVEAAQEAESKRYLDSRELAIQNAIEAIPSELTRGRRFKETPQSQIDLGIRWQLLSRNGKQCALYEEKRHYLERTRGEVGDWVEDLPGDQRPQRWKRAERMYDERGRELGIFGPNTPYGTRPGELIFTSTSHISSPIRMLIYGSLTPESFRGTLATHIEKCLEPPLQEAAWVEMIELAKKMKLLDQPISYTMGEGPSPITVGVSMRLHRAYLRALNTGADAQVIAMTEAELARYPEGANGRSLVLRRIKEIIRVGERYESKKARRLGLSEDVLTGLARAVRDQAPEALQLDNELCKALATHQARPASSQLEYVQTANERGRESAVSLLGRVVAPLIRTGCIQGSTPLTYDDALQRIITAATLRHPGTLGKEKCDKEIKELTDALSSTYVQHAAGADAAYQAQVLGQRWGTCTTYTATVAWLLPNSH